MEVTGDRTMKLREAGGRPAWAVRERTGTSVDGEICQRHGLAFKSKVK